jgi:redox-sensitive bicupin YhaK (pirin superfamily)
MTAAFIWFALGRSSSAQRRYKGVLALVTHACRKLTVETTRHAFAYVFAGAGKFSNASGPLAVPTEAVEWADTHPPSEADNRSLLLFDRGDEVTVQAGDEGVRFLLVSGKPLEEPVAWYGPIVMNTQAELRDAFDELERGKFLKTG